MFLEPRPKEPTTDVRFNLAKPFDAAKIRELIRKTHTDNGPITVRPHGRRFNVELDFDHFSGNVQRDQLGSIRHKGRVHWQMGTMREAATDAFAMAINDMIEGGYIPVKFMDYIRLSESERSNDAVFAIVNRLVELALENPWTAKGFGSQRYPIVINDGDTSILSGFNNGLEIGIVLTGYTRKGCEIRQNLQENSAIIGLPSSGVHSNGSFRFIVEELLGKGGKRLDEKLGWGPTLGEELTRPSEVYLQPAKALMGHFLNSTKSNVSVSGTIHGMVHITGGGLLKLTELLQDRRLDIVLNNTHRLKPQEIFHYIQREGNVPSFRMYTRFNNGIGYAIAVDKYYADESLEVLRKFLPNADIIGEVKSGDGKLIIPSSYEDKRIEYRRVQINPGTSESEAKYVFRYL